MKRNIYKKVWTVAMLEAFLSSITSISCVYLTCCCATVADCRICFLQLITDILLTHRSSLVHRTIQWSMSTLTRAAPKVTYEWWYVCGTITSAHTEREESTRAEKEEGKKTTTNQQILYSISSVLCM